MADVRIVELLINVKMVMSLMKQWRCLTKEMGFNGSNSTYVSTNN